MNEDWVELGNFTVTDTASRVTTSVKLWQGRNEDGTPAPEYQLDVNHQTVYIPAEAMTGLYRLIGRQRNGRRTP